MSVYRKPNGDEVVVCDTCGVTHDGAPLDETATKIDWAAVTKIDWAAVMRAAGFPHGSDMTITDTCPDCEKKAKW